MVGYHLVRLSQGTVMQTDTLVPRTLRSTATELRKLPPKQRDAILEVAAALAERDYHDNVELNAFDAFGKDDLHGDSSSAQTR
jgi:acyl-CoA reductase-like NAD-dependent aldehyde dehydrogenase